MADAGDLSKPRLLSASVLAEFVREAALGFLPALLILPLFAVALAIGMVAGDGTILEPFEKLRGKALAGLVPLLFGAVINPPHGTILAVGAGLGPDANGWVTLICFCGVALVGACYAFVRSLKAIVKRLERESR